MMITHHQKKKKISPNHTLCRNFFFISVKGLSCLVNRCQNKHFKKITKKKVIKRVKIINFSQVFLPNWEDGFLWVWVENLQPSTFPSYPIPTIPNKRKPPFTSFNFHPPPFKFIIMLG